MSRPHHKNGKKPIAEVSSGSVTIPIHTSPVTIKIGKKPSPNSEADSKLNGDGSERKTHTSFKVVYYEGTQRVFRRRKPNVRAEDGRLMNRFAFPPEKLHIASFNTVGTLLKPRHWSAAGVQHVLKSIGASGGTIFSSNAAIMLASRFDLEAEILARPGEPRPA